MRIMLPFLAVLVGLPDAPRVPLQRYEQPADGLSAQLTLDQTQVTLGQPVHASLGVRNHTQVPVRLTRWGNSFVPAWEYYLFDSIGHRVPATRWAIDRSLIQVADNDGPVPFTIAPAALYPDVFRSMPLHLLFDLSCPGTYTLVIKRRVTMQPVPLLVLVSNPVTFRVIAEDAEDREAVR